MTTRSLLSPKYLQRTESLPLSVKAYLSNAALVNIIALVPDLARVPYFSYHTRKTMSIKHILNSFDFKGFAASRDRLK